MPLFFSFNHFLETRAEILKKIVDFLAKRWHQKVLLELSNLFTGLSILRLYIFSRKNILFSCNIVMSIQYSINSVNRRAKTCFFIAYSILSKIRIASYVIICQRFPSITYIRQLIIWIGISSKIFSLPLGVKKT